MVPWTAEGDQVTAFFSLLPIEKTLGKLSLTLHNASLVAAINFDISRVLISNVDVIETLLISLMGRLLATASRPVLG